VDLRLLRRIVKALLQDLLRQENFDLGIYLVAAPKMTELNETFLRHKGPTDVIAFDYANRGCKVQSPKSKVQSPQPDAGAALLHGEIFVCVEEAISQARRFRTIWQSELVRYIVHGLLHLCGYDDRHATARRGMKREEDRLLRRLARQFDLGKAGSRTRKS